MGERSFYLSDFADECLPCEPTLEGWASWLNGPDVDWNRHAPASDGASYFASAIVWDDDIVAQRVDGRWSLSRSPDENAFVAVRFGEGLGWSAENIINQAMRYDADAGEYRLIGTMEDALLAWLFENDHLCDDVEFIAMGRHEDGWRVTFHSMGAAPRCTAERVQ